MNQSMLIIDDDTAVLASCQRIFTEEGFKVTTTTNPSEGIELATNNQYTVVLCDWHMPELDGMDVVTKLETDAPDSAVVMISGYPSVGRATEAMQRGVMDYLPKPFTPEDLAAQIKETVPA